MHISPFARWAIGSNWQNVPDSGEIREAYGTLQNVSIRHEDVEIIFDFHMFDIQDFDLLIGHPIEKLLTDAPTQNKLEVHLG